MDSLSVGATFSSLRYPRSNFCYAIHSERVSQSLLFSYDLEDRQSIAEFNYIIDKPARLIGLPKAVLYMSCEERDNFTVFVIQASIKRVSGRERRDEKFSHS